MTSVDYLVVGSGLTGSVIARVLADAGREVLIVERRDHHGGNVYDHIHAPSGIRIHTYGPHYFRTSSERIWEFVRRFGAFFTYEPCVKSLIDGHLENWPIAADYIRRHVGEHWKPEFSDVPRNFEEAALALMPRRVYEKFVKEYNEKQWGIPAQELSVSLCKRFNVHHDNDPRFTPSARHQGIPVDGYATLMKRLIDGIPIRLGYDYLERRGEINARRMLVFTGPIDAFFGYEFGRLKYRGQLRETEYYQNNDFIQPVGQINAPQHVDGPHIRTLEWKHMMPPHLQASVRGTVLTRETPYTPTDVNGYEYPFPDEPNSKLYQQYSKRLEAMEKTLVCGRLGEYRYYDMDQAIARALLLAERILSNANAR